MRKLMPPPPFALSCLTAFALFLGSHPAESQSLTSLEQLGKSIFFDTNLSAGRTQACASCHDPDFGFTSPRGDLNAGGSVVEGAVAGRFGNRRPPSAAYAAFAPAFTHGLDEGEVVFLGGLFLDGRATGARLGSPLADQAQGPFLNPAEMAMPSAACVVDRVVYEADPALYPVGYGALFPSDVPPRLSAADAAACDGSGPALAPAQEEAAEAAFNGIALALAAYERSDEVNRFSSRYDRFVAGQGGLSDDERAGLALFTDAHKGNCAACHVLTPNSVGGPAVLTDWTYDNIGVPKNRENPFYRQTTNKDGQRWIDPGLGGHLATDPALAPFAKANWARHQVPTLRNLTIHGEPGAARSYMHNGWFKTLEGVVHFYNTRDVLPACSDPLATEAEARAANCWPAPEFAETMNRDELGNLHLTGAEEAQIVAFLRTLDDAPPSP